MRNTLPGSSARGQLGQVRPVASHARRQRAAIAAKRSSSVSPSCPGAERDLTEALSIATRGGMRLHEADAHLGWARLSLAQHNTTQAKESLDKARLLIDTTGYHRRDKALAELTSRLVAAEGFATATP